MCDGRNNMDKKDICVVIPTHKYELSEQEKHSLKQCYTILKDYDIRIACPEKIKNAFQNDGFFVESFDNECFSSKPNYNNFKVSYALYERFKKYKYVLIHELDAFVFKDELLQWAEKDYDVIGAPWCQFCSNKDDNLVGNGGLSLRKVQTFISLLNGTNIDLSKRSGFFRNEDFFLANFLFKTIPFEVKIPSCKEALNFSVENNALLHVKRGTRPFGMHGYGNAISKEDFEQILSILLKQ